MSVRQALTYNIVSSVLCFLGMFIGIILGNINQASLWIFAFTAGTFIYISLVDMVNMWIFAHSFTTISLSLILNDGHLYFSILSSFQVPELTEQQKDSPTSKSCTLILQCFGISIGIAIMLLIALFEHQIKINLGDAGS